MSLSVKDAFIGAGLVVAGIGSVLWNPIMHSAASGAHYLEKRGYTHVTGGNTRFLNPCAKDEFVRVYQAQDSKGKTVERNVCFGSIFGPHAPLFEIHRP